MGKRLLNQAIDRATQPYRVDRRFSNSLGAIEPMALATALSCPSGDNPAIVISRAVCLGLREAVIHDLEIKNHY